jgi:hypothetical protein
MLPTTLRRCLSIPSEETVKTLFAGKCFQEAIETALDHSHRREIRKRSLPARMIMLLVVALSLFRTHSIPAVYRILRGWGLRRNGRKSKSVTDEALCHARARLGPNALQCLFEEMVQSMDQIVPTFHGLRVYAADGVKLSLPDTKANEARFGRWTASRGDRTAFPQAMIIALVAAETRLVRAIRVAPAVTRELEACSEFLDALGPQDLVLMDRGFHAVWLFMKFIQRGAHFLCRASASYRPIVLFQLGRGDYIVKVKARVLDGNGGRKKVSLMLRMIEYRLGKRTPVRLLTNLLTPTKYTALELARLYRERWECELAFDEIKTHLATPPHGGLQLPIRSKDPDGVTQEIYGLFVAYNLVRSWISTAAKIAHLRPRQISFVGALHVLNFAISAYGAIPEMTQTLMRLIREQRLKRIRRNRWYARVLRIKHKHFPRKRFWNDEHHIDYAALLRLVDLHSAHQIAA